VTVRALLLDFNGTLSHDEPILCELFCELFAEQGKPLSAQEYFDRFAGLSDPEIVRRWLGRDDPELVAEHVRRYLARAGDGSSVLPEAAQAVRAAAGRVRIAVVSGALREMVEAVLAGAGLDGLFDAVVTAEDVERGKPDPAGYERALELLGVPPAEAVAIEDSEDGVKAAKAAGVYVAAVLGTAEPSRLAAADVIADRLDPALIERLLRRAAS
jgi:HAD superfamily hydrolase (TIGR01509 family)